MLLPISLWLLLVEYLVLLSALLKSPLITFLGESGSCLVIATQESCILLLTFLVFSMLFYLGLLLYFQASLLVYSHSGYNFLYGHQHVKTYYHQYGICASVVRYLRVCGSCGSAETHEMINTICASFRYTIHVLNNCFMYIATSLHLHWCVPYNNNNNNNNYSRVLSMQKARPG